jgi:hypothetical protein
VRRTHFIIVISVLSAVLIFNHSARGQTGEPLYLPLVVVPRVTPTASVTRTATTTVTATSTATATTTATSGPGSPTATATRTSTTVAPSPTPTLPPPSFVSCATPPANPGSAPNYPLLIASIDKSAETVTLRNTTTGATISLSGWQMCSITGGQNHPISGSLAPGESRIFPNNGGLIWNNLTSDPGALYDPEGRLISYFAD